MKAIITENIGRLNVNDRKEDHFYEEWAVLEIQPERVLERVILRIYTTQSRSYACLWVFDGKTSRSGSGHAGGYGYHRPSAAAGVAIRHAGIELDEDIDGRGNSAIREACLAIAEAVTPGGRFYVHEANG